MATVVTETYLKIILFAKIFAFIFFINIFLYLRFFIFTFSHSESLQISKTFEKKKEKYIPLI